MKQIVYCLMALVLVTSLFGFKEKTNNGIHDFKLQDVQGKYVSLSDYSNAKGFIIIFTCNHCPFAKLYPSRLNELNNKYGPKGFPLLAISSTDTITYEEDSYEKMIEKAEEGKYNFPYLFDGTQEVAKNFEAQKTPHAYVLLKGKGGWEIKYNGAIDDNGAEPNLVKEHFVADAVDALLSGKEPKTKETKSIGCQIYFRK